jgi:hypothetical protein
VLDKYYPIAPWDETKDYSHLKSANKTNSSVNRVGKTFKVLGPAGTLASAALAANQITNADNKIREAFGVGGSLIGGLAGGAGGTALGTMVAPGPGTVIGGIGGSIAGSAYGEHRGYELYDKFGRRFSR